MSSGYVTSVIRCLQAPLASITTAITHGMYKILSFPYRGSVEYYTLGPINNIINEAKKSNPDLTESLFNLRQRKLQELDFVHKAAALSAAAAVGCLSWSDSASAFWLCPMFWRSSLWLSIFSLVSSAQSRLMEKLPATKDGNGKRNRGPNQVDRGLGTHNTGNGEDEEETVHPGTPLMDGNDHLADTETAFPDTVPREASIKLVSLVARHVSDGEITKLKDREKAVKDMRDYISRHYRRFRPSKRDFETDAGGPEAPQDTEQPQGDATAAPALNAQPQVGTLNLRKDHLLLWLWQTPMMLMSWSWVLFLVGYTCFFLTPFVNSTTKDLEGKDKISSWACLGVGAFALVNFFICGRKAQQILRML